MIRKPLLLAMNFAVLLKQDDLTSERVLALLHSNESFRGLSGREGEDMIRRDVEDETKLSLGIKIAVAKGVLKANIGVAPICKIDVVGKSADDVATEILGKLHSKEGNVLVLQGLSGTGKGTTVKKLQAALPKCVCWSNGNVFRSITHLVSEHCSEKKVEFASSVLTADLLKTTVQRLSFQDMGEDMFDVVIDNHLRVSTIQNTLLKMPHISSRVPTVAEQTQGEVIHFAAAAVETLRLAGCNVILEGRAQTLNYIPTPYRFELVIPDPVLLGQRRAAQRVMAVALSTVCQTSSEADVEEAVLNAATSLK